MHYPRYRTSAKRPVTRSATAPLTFVLLIAVPAIVAVAALRPR
ncbi:hypothetical protein OHT76_37620 [Streptomyces sp. NBC_00287]|nr:hypothetical protein [Streptomyces sp. NBC_00287]